ncbi:hypothetical protein PJL15_02714 [Paenarthrobacter nitroguajacolicus]|nr:hypothetical protein [Paenarthrobacter nitroguajacolicus]
MGFPGGNLTLAGLARGGGGVQSLAHGLENRLNVQPQQGADAGRGRGPEVGDVVDFVLVQADGFDQVHLDFVAGGDGTDQILAVGTHVLGHSQDRRDVIPGVGVVGGEERVVVVQFTHGHTVGPRSPLRGDLLVDAEHVGAFAVRGRGVGQCLRPGRDDRCPVERGNGYGGVVDDPVDHHVSDLGGDLDGVGGDHGDLVCQLLLAGEVLFGLVDTDVVVLDHDAPSDGTYYWWDAVAAGCVALRWVRLRCR